MSQFLLPGGILRTGSDRPIHKNGTGDHDPKAKVLGLDFAEPERSGKACEFLCAYWPGGPAGRMEL